MTAEGLAILIFVVAVIVGPIATLRAVSQYRQRKTRRSAPPPAGAGADDKDDNDKSSFW